AAPERGADPVRGLPPAQVPSGPVAGAPPPRPVLDLRPPGADRLDVGNRPARKARGGAGGGAAVGGLLHVWRGPRVVPAHEAPRLGGLVLPGRRGSSPRGPEFGAALGRKRSDREDPGRSLPGGPD